MSMFINGEPLFCMVLTSIKMPLMQILVLIKINFPILQMGHRLMSIPVLINMHKRTAISTFGIGDGKSVDHTNLLYAAFFLGVTNIRHDVYHSEQRFPPQKVHFWISKW
jgi:hypothetical protein